MAKPPRHRDRPPTTIVDWERSDNFHNSHVLQKDEILDAAIQNSEANGLPAISVSPAQGKLLYLLAKSIGAKRILEVGTLGGSVVYFGPSRHHLSHCEVLYHPPCEGAPG